MTIPELNKKQIKEFIKNGYVIIPEAMPSELLDAAESHIDEAFDAGEFKRKNKIGSEEGIPAFNKKVKSADAILELYRKSGARKVAQQLFGDDNATLRKEIGQVVYTTQSEVFVEKGWTPDKHLQKTKWRIISGDGDKDDEDNVGTDFSVLVGVTLSEGQDTDENRGQLTVFPGSHEKVHDFLRKTIKNTPDGEDAIEKFKEGKKELDIGKPVRVTVNRGDVVLVHQRLAHMHGVNLTEKPAKNVYFKVGRKDMDDIQKKIWDSDTPWVGFEGIAEHLPDGVTEV